MRKLIHRLQELTEAHHGTSALKKRIGTSIYDDDDIVRVNYRGTNVFTLDRRTGEMTLNTGGWFTSTTFDRMNHAMDDYGIDGGVFRKNGVAYLSLGGVNIPFEGDSLTININDVDNMFNEYINNYEKGDLIFTNKNISEFPANIKKVRGSLVLSRSNIDELPEGLIVTGTLNLTNSSLTELPKKLKVGALYFDDTSALEFVPQTLIFRSIKYNYNSYDNYYDFVVDNPDLADPSFDDVDAEMEKELSGELE